MRLDTQRDVEMLLERFMDQFRPFFVCHKTLHSVN